MNSYSLALSGSWFILILCIIVSVIISYFSYRNTVPQIAPTKKIFLTILRSLALTLLFFILFQPILSTVWGTFEKPRLIAMIDNSLSMQIADAGGERKSMYESVINKLSFDDFDAEQIKTLLFDSEVKEISKLSLDSIKLTGQQTDISKAIRNASFNQEIENTQAAVLVSDGAFNLGNNPLYDAEKFGKPIYVIGIGDTNEPKDLSIQSVYTNQIAYIDNPVPINVNLKVNGYNEGNVKLVLSDNGTKISEATIDLTKNSQNYSHFFEYMPKLEGMHKLTISAVPLDNEITLKNNEIIEFIKVQKNKKKIVLFAGSPSADLAFVKNTLLQEKGVEIKSYIQKQGAEFYENPNEKDIKESQIIVMIGFPIASTPAIVIKLISNELEQGKPLLFIASNDLAYSNLGNIKNFLPFSIVSTNKKEYQALVNLDPGSLSNSLLRINGNEEDAKLWSSLPPVLRTETFVKMRPDANMIMSIKINNVELNEPLIASSNIQNQKTIAIMAYGLFRWKLVGYAQDLSKGRSSTDLFKVLMQNTTKWLSSDNQTKYVQIKTSKQNYNSNEAVEFIAQIYDDAYNPLDNAKVNVKVHSGSETREIMLNNISNGRYTASLNGLNQGTYQFEGFATYNNKILGEDRGKFTVGESGIEYTNLRMNIELLKEIASTTGGKFYLAKDVEEFKKDLKNLKSFKERAITNKKEIAVWNLVWLTLFVILLFSTEWFFRKRFGLL